MQRVFAVVACLIALHLHAQPAQPPRPKVGLVLSGGGARGLAHIGVLKVLQEQRVPVDFIVATSMGSIVGGAYAAGQTPEGMEKLVRDANWSYIFSDRAPREDLSFRRKEDDLRLIGRSELGLKSDGIVFPRGALGSQNLEEFLRGVTPHGNDVPTLNDLPILFRAVATDLATGEQVVLSEVPLTVAMRASMSIPGAFAPAQVQGRLLADGGLVRNLPVEVAREMGADVIIAVNVGTPLLPRESLSSALGVAQQMVNILTEQNVGISLAQLRPTDILISPDLRDVSFVDFDKAGQSVTRGEAAARAVIPRLAGLAVSASQFAAWESERTRFAVIPERPVADIRVAGTQRVNPEALRRDAVERAGIEVGKTVTNEQLVKAARVIHGSGEFERVDVRTELEQGRRSVVIDVDEKPWGPNYLRLGGRAVSDFSTGASFSLILQHKRTWVNSWGGEWRNELEVGDRRRLMTTFFQPLGPGNPWFVEGVLHDIKSDSDVYEGFRRTDRFTSETAGTYGFVGRRIGNIAVARLGVGYERYRIAPTISSRFEGTDKDSARVAQLSLTVDTLDDPNFPRRGFGFTADTTTIDYRGSDAIQTWSMNGLFPVTFDRLTLLGIMNFQRSRDDRGGFALGDFLYLSGTPRGSIQGSQSAFLGGLAYYRMGNTRGAFGGDWYAGFSLEAGNAWRRASDVGRGDVKKAASTFVGLDSILGPLYFAYGKTFGGESAFYLFLGRPTSGR